MATRPAAARLATPALRRRLGGVFLALVSAVLLVTCGVFYLRGQHVLLGESQTLLRVQAAQIAEGIDGARHDALRGADDPAYAEIRAHLVRARHIDPRTRDVYTMRRDPDGTWRFLVDAEPPGGSIHSPFGTPYDATQDPALPRALEGPTASEGVYTDEYGSWMSGYAPIRTEDGRVVGVVGVDISAAALAAEARVQAALALGVFAVGIALAALAGRFLLARVADPLVLEQELVEAQARELAAERDRALRTAEAKSEFLSVVSHELRTPLTGVVGMTELLARSPLTPTQREHLGVLERSTQLLLVLVDDLLDYAKDEAGKLELDDVPYSLPGVVEQVRGLLEPKAREKGLYLDTRVAPEIPTRVLGDPARVQQILLNLVGNAVKFTARGSVELTVGVRDGRMRTEVRDTGIGFTPEARARMFQPFQQADRTVARRFGGTGLGLYITRRLVERMGGSIGVESELGVGSTFWFEVPLRAVSEPPARPAPAPAPSRSWPGRRALVADDDPVNRRILLAHLQGLGFDAVAVGEGRAAVDLAARETWDVLVVDCRMPDLDGYEVARRVRAHPGPGRPVLLAVTADALADVRERCLAAGFDAVLAKPFDAAGMAAALAGHLPPG